MITINYRYRQTTCLSPIRLSINKPWSTPTTSRTGNCRVNFRKPRAKKKQHKTIKIIICANYRKFKIIFAVSPFFGFNAFQLRVSWFGGGAKRTFSTDEPVGTNIQLQLYWKCNARILLLIAICVFRSVLGNVQSGAIVIEICATNRK